MRGRRGLLGVIVCLLAAGGEAPSAGATGAVSASALAGCPPFGFAHAGTRWNASNVRVNGVSCLTAKGLIMSYARPMNCQFRFPCHIGRYVCRTTASVGSRFQETCVSRTGSVRWLGGYISR